MSLHKICMALASALALPVAAMALDVADMKCEYLDNGACIHTGLPPRLSWTPVDTVHRGARQSAYRILVASSPKKLKPGKADLWDSGKVMSAATAQISYGGKELGSFQRCYWSVLLWDGDGKPGRWSEPASWSMGVLAPDDWDGARWIALRPAEEWQSRWQAQKEHEKAHEDPAAWPMRNYGEMNLLTLLDSVKPDYDAAPLLRKRFSAPRKLKSAQLYICGLGYFEAFINGQRVGNDVLNPAWTNFDQTSLYSAYDVTSLLDSGSDNAIGVMLGRGQYSPVCNDVWELCHSSWVSQPKLIALLRMEAADGTVSTVVTDGSWRVAEGPILFDDTRIGEIYDARKEQPGWDTSAFDDSTWDQASIVDWPMSALRAQMLPPIRCKAPYRPVRRIARPDGTTIFDIGQNISGWARVKVEGPRGARVLVEYCELPTDSTLVTGLHPARFKMLDAIPDKHYAAFTDATLPIRQQNAYILKGGGVEEFECHFSYKGFQFVRLTVDDGVSVISLEGVPVHSDLRSVGSFACSDSVANKLQAMSRITMLNNFMGIPTDCPHREKQGWTADAYFTTEAAIYNFDMARFYSKWLRDLSGTQGSDGALCTVAPSSGYCLGASIAWPAGMVYVPENMYDYYGDRRILAEYYGSMAKFAGRLRSHEIPDRPGEVAEVLGDWVSPTDSIVPELVGSSLMAPPEGVVTYGASSYYSVLRRMERISQLLGKPSDADHYRLWGARVRRDFNSAYFRPADAAYYGTIPTGYRLAPNVVALYEGLVPDTAVEAVGSKFLANLERDRYKMKVGFLGTRAMMKWLPLHDAEAAWRVATQPEYPGWGYMVASGANTMWEDWAACASVNHLPYCLISEYFYKHLAGIKLSHNADGTPDIEISPSIVGDLRWASGSYRSIYGTIRSSWRRHDGSLELDVTIPANHTAIVVVPLSSPDATVTESGIDAAQSPGVTLLGRTPAAARYRVASGRYTFTAR